MKKKIELNQNQMGGLAVAVIAIAVLSFFVGMNYSRSTAQNGAQRGAYGPGMSGGQRGGRMGGSGMTAGTILSKDDKSITVKLATPPGATPDDSNNAGSRVVFLNDKTQVGKFSIGSVDDLTVGTTVTVNGSTNSDGSISAAMVQIRPAGMPAYGSRTGAPAGGRAPAQQ